MIKVLTFLSIVFCICLSLDANVNVRQGFCIQAGLTISPISVISSDNPLVDESRVAFGLDIAIGYSLDNRTVLVIRDISAFYQPSHGLVNSSDQSLLGTAVYRTPVIKLNHSII
jgi:hypothetical protein